MRFLGLRPRELMFFIIMLAGSCGFILAVAVESSRLIDGVS